MTESFEIEFSFPPCLSDRFKELKLIGSGGMGCVYRGLDTRLKRFVALKVVRCDSNNQKQFKRRFEREVLSLAAIKHPNIIEIYDFESDEETMFFSMEHVKGLSFAELVQSRKMAVNELIGLFVKIANALAAVHEAGLLHRDIKPANIMVSSDGVPKLMDFGLSRFTARSDLTTLTKTNDVVGTVPYMAPETLTKKQHDRASDIYQLGLSIYEVLAGKRPYSTEEIGMFLIGGTPNVEPLSNFVHGVDSALDAIIFKAMAFDCKKRYQQANELAADLEQWLAGDCKTSKVEPLSSTSVLDASESKKLKRLFGLGLIVAFLLLLFFLWWPLGSSKEANLIVLAKRLHTTSSVPKPSDYREFLQTLAQHPRSLEPSVNKSLMELLPKSSATLMMVKAHTSHNEAKRNEFLTIALDCLREELKGEKGTLTPEHLLLESHTIEQIADYFLRHPSSLRKEKINSIERLLLGSAKFLSSLSIEVRTDLAAKYHRSLLCFLRAEALAHRNDQFSRRCLEDMAASLSWRSHYEKLPPECQVNLLHRLKRIRKLVPASVVEKLDRASALLVKDKKMNWQGCMKQAMSLKDKALDGFRKESGNAAIVTSVLSKRSKRVIEELLRTHRQAYWQLSALCERMDVANVDRKEFVILVSDVMASPMRDRLADLYAKGKWGLGLAPKELLRRGRLQCEILYLIGGAAKDHSFFQATIRWFDRLFEYFPEESHLCEPLLQLIGEEEAVCHYFRSRAFLNQNKKAKAHSYLKKGFEILKKEVTSSGNEMTPVQSMLLYYLCDDRWVLEREAAFSATADEDLLWVMGLYSPYSAEDWQRSLWFLAFYTRVRKVAQKAANEQGKKKANILRAISPFIKKLREIAKDENFSERKRQKCKALLMGRIPHN